MIKKYRDMENGTISFGKGDKMEKILTIITALLAIVCIALCWYKIGKMSQKEMDAHVIVMYTSAEQAYTKFDKPCEWYDPEMYTE